MFKICQGTCFCAANAENSRDNRETVLYCFGEVVLKKDSLRGEETSAKASLHQNLDEYHMQLAQLVITFLLIFLVLIVLLLIRKGLLRILIQMRRIVRLLEYQGPNGQSDTLRRDKEYLRYSYPREYKTSRVLF